MMRPAMALVGGLLVAGAYVVTHGDSHAVSAIVYHAGECRAVDGDTLNCKGERIRLNGIDAPEMPGHCRRGRDCVPGNPYDSRVSLASQIIGGVRIERLKVDRYGRTVAAVETSWGDDISCAQIRRGQAIYKPRWDEHHRLGESCRSLK